MWGEGFGEAMISVIIQSKTADRSPMAVLKPTPRAGPANAASNPTPTTTCVTPCEHRQRPGCRRPWQAAVAAYAALHACSTLALDGPRLITNLDDLLDKEADQHAQIHHVHAGAPAIVGGKGWCEVAERGGSRQAYGSRMHTCTKWQISRPGGRITHSHCQLRRRDAVVERRVLEQDVLEQPGVELQHRSLQIDLQRDPRQPVDHDIGNAVLGQPPNLGEEEVSLPRHSGGGRGQVQDRALQAMGRSSQKGSSGSSR